MPLGGSLDRYRSISDAKGNMNVVICVYQVQGAATESKINRILFDVQQELQKELEFYSKIKTSYVYENKSTTSVKPFEELTKDSPIIYKESYEKTVHNLAHVLIMGLTLLEREQEPFTENRLYLLTDETRQYERVQINQIICKESGASGNNAKINPRFNGICHRMYLYTTSEENCSELRKIFNIVRVYRD